MLDTDTLLTYALCRDLWDMFLQGAVLRLERVDALLRGLLFKSFGRRIFKSFGRRILQGTILKLEHVDALLRGILR